MMNLFRKKRPAEQQPEPASPPEAVEPPPSPAAAPPSYESWSPEGPPGAIGGGEFVPQLIEAAPEAADTLPTPPGLSPDHPLAGQIARALSSVYDPEIPVDIYQLGLVYGVTLNEANDARICMTLTTPGCPVAGSMPGMVEHAVATMVEGIGDVGVELVWGSALEPRHDVGGRPARTRLHVAAISHVGFAMKDILTISERAAERINHLMSLRPSDAEPTVGIKIGIRNAGCSGMSYTMDYAEEAPPGAEVISQRGVTVVVDPAAVMFLIGTELDFSEEKLSATFVFNNPNVTSTCGCGESFGVG